MENKIKQLRKGIFELVILSALQEGKYYGYSLIKTITENQPISINEGTLYPILSRLAKEGLVHTEWVESSQGPPRKYYSLSIRGTETLQALGNEFEKLITLFRNVKEVIQGNNQKSKPKKITVKKEKEDEKQQ